MREKRHNLVVEYKGGMDQDKDRQERPKDGSGFCFMDSGQDLIFGFATMAAPSAPWIGSKSP